MSEILFKNKITDLARKGMEKKSLSGDEKYEKRLSFELKTYDELNAFEYFSDLYDKCIKEDLVLACNENNLLVPYLLELTDEFNIEEESCFVYGDWPDVDLDFLPFVRDYLRNVWAPKTFGEDNVCSIGAYQTLGIKQAMQDVVRVYGLDRNEVVAITTGMEDKDNDGKPLTWDKALEMYPDFANYCKQHPDVAADVKLFISRNKSRGQHAAGLVISSKRIDDFVPLEVGKDGSPVSAWGEGLHSQDLQPVGFIKMDYLVITNNLQVAKACKLIKERYNLTSICALPGGRDWSDVSYLNDPLAIKAANEGDLKGIFQFDSEGIRSLVRRGGVDSFDDLVAYSALYRPSAMQSGMHERYIKRKKKLEEYEIHPLLKDVLGKTYSVMVYQEQVMRILNIVGKIPLKDCETVRKAISKKKVENFISYKNAFIENGQRVLGISKEEVENFWNQIEAFAGYGFNLSHSVAYTYLSSRLLWLKSHYPLEFYTAILSCEETDSKIKDYKLDAHKHGIEIQKINLNKSKIFFDVVDDKIYFGFFNIKGIGEEVAKKIVEGQPYVSFEDFLSRFGTEAGVIKPLIALGAFDEFNEDRILLYKFYEAYKDWKTRKVSRDRRYVHVIEKQQKELETLLPDNPELAKFEEECYEKWDQFDKDEEIYLGDEEVIDIVALEEKYKITRRELREKIKQEAIPEEEFQYIKKPIIKKFNRYNELCKLRRKREKSLDDLDYKISRQDISAPKLSKFDPSEWTLPEEVKELITSNEIAEAKFYGFLWHHPLEKSPDYNGLTIDKFLSEAESEGIRSGPIEVVIQNVEVKISKNDKPYCLITVEDASSQSIKVIMWNEDYQRFKDDLIVGNFVRMRTSPPSGGFRTLTFWSPSKRDRAKMISKNKAEDTRLLVLRKE